MCQAVAKQEEGGFQRAALIFAEEPGGENLLVEFKDGGGGDWSYGMSRGQDGHDVEPATQGGAFDVFPDARGNRRG